ncbi:MAG: metallophosphoesterase family protein [Candidatus Latescibacterota bacterium]
MSIVRILFLADTHLGFDYPFRPRVEKNRRGPDFFANFNRALEHVSEEKIDLVIHGGDILFRSKVPAGLVEMAFAPLRKLADRGVPVFVVPGNHERSGIPFRLLAEHSRIHIFDNPRTFRRSFNGVRLALAGFPCVREGIRTDFTKIMEQTGWRDIPADISLLCMHQCVEGATVGPNDFTFRNGADVIRAADIPEGLTAVLSGHIHRFQALTRDLRGNSLRAPVLYPGSVERTSFAEKAEKKGYLLLELDTGSPEKPALRWTFHELPARPMAMVNLTIEGMTAPDITRKLRNFLAEIPENGVVKVAIKGTPKAGSLTALSAASLRSLSPSGMNVEITFPRDVQEWNPRKDTH